MARNQHEDIAHLAVGLRAEACFDACDHLQFEDNAESGNDSNASKHENNPGSAFDFSVRFRFAHGSHGVHGRDRQASGTQQENLPDLAVSLGACVSRSSWSIMLSCRR